MLNISRSNVFGKFVLIVNTKLQFTDCCKRQNFCPSLLHFVDRLYTVIHKTQKTRTKVLQSATVGE